ncbi:thiol reductant ABC exporter subunit CydC [Slackia piriformis]|uniref:Thiol reductant ABC exporter, CydC subunit n=1 Tax=Slackia piriformis YIT 12062 TaxID=742818 RepID=K0YMX0_9ACTN|nr:thiol reductant ABC exporter subunit CydC [Slackia piriformis]EJZ84668.1 thiol reductant ABC exporter, CydC subunit [Slackia piriformis YIT 12062]
MNKTAAEQTPRMVSTLHSAWRQDEWVKPFFARYAHILALTLLLGLLAFVFAGALMFTSGYMISLAATLPLTVLALHLPSLFVRIFGLGKPILQYVERLASHDWVLRMTSELRRKLYETIERRSSALRSQRRFGEALGLLSEDIGHVQDLYLRTILPIASAWLLYLVAIIALGFFTVPVACAMALMLGVALFVMPLVSVCANGARLMRAKAITSKLYDDLSDNVLGVSDWVFSGRSDDYLGRYKNLQKEARRIDAAIKRHNRVRDVLLQVLFGLCAVVLLLWASATFASQESASGLALSLASLGNENAPAYAANWIAAFVLCFFPLIEAFSPVPTAALGIVTHSNAVANLNEYSRESMQERTVPFASAAPSAEHGSANGDSRPCDIRFENVTFSYPGTNRPVLRNLSLAIPHGGVVAVLGRSGAGKSTFASLLRGEGAPDSGRIFVGNTDTACQEFSAMRLVGVIQQNPHIFNQSLRENLLIGKGNATDDELWDALERVGLRPRAKQLPNGLDTVIDESGKSFSGGERHRIALARILLSKPAIVILDEPFAGLDPATEQALLETMLSTLEGSTVLLITHHLQGVSRADRVLFFENGGIAMDGSPAELERSNERYRTLLAFDSGNVGPSSSHEAK